MKKNITCDVIVTCDALQNDSNAHGRERGVQKQLKVHNSFKKN